MSEEIDLEDEAQRQVARYEAGELTRAQLLAQVTMGLPAGDSEMMLDKSYAIIRRIESIAWKEGRSEKGEHVEELDHWVGWARANIRPRMGAMVAEAELAVVSNRWEYRGRRWQEKTARYVKRILDEDLPRWGY